MSSLLLSHNLRHKPGDKEKGETLFTKVVSRCLCYKISCVTELLYHKIWILSIVIVKRNKILFTPVIEANGNIAFPSGEGVNHGVQALYGCPATVVIDG